MLVGCVGLYGERVDETKLVIEKLRPNIDRYIVIADETVTDEQKNVLEGLGCEVHIHPWEDSMVKMRNQYLDKLKIGDWAIVHDPDECFNEAFCKDVRLIIGEAEKRGAGLLLINSHDITHDPDGNIRTTTSNFYKNLIFKKLRDTRYEGVGEVREVHEILIIPDVGKTERIDTKYWYTHTKHYYEVWERAGRNVFMAGGGNNLGTKNPSWRPLRELCDSLGLKNWTKARNYFRKGNIDPRLKKWFWDNRFEGFDYHHEMMEFGRWYFEYLHPKEKMFPNGKVWEAVTKLSKDSPPEVMRYVEKCYLEVLGRHGDQAGKEHYTTQIIEGHITREDLPQIFRESREYRDKIG